MASDAMKPLERVGNNPLFYAQGIPGDFSVSSDAVLKAQFDAIEAGARRTDHSTLHNLLVFADRFRLMPGLVVILFSILTAFIAVWAWTELKIRVPIMWGTALGDGIRQSILLATALAGSWLCTFIVWSLRPMKRSFGHWQASAMGLSVLIALGIFASGVIERFWKVGFTPALIWTGIVVILAFYSTWIEPFRLGITRQTLIVPGWGEPLRLLHLSDLHVERETARERDLNAKISRLQPHVIVFTGDFINLSYQDDARAEADVRRTLSGWHAPLGVYAISGTPAVEPPARVAAFVRDMDNIQFLPNRWVNLSGAGGDVHLLGMITTHDLPVDRSALAVRAGEAPSKSERPAVKILLEHAPDLAPEAAEHGFDLYLCGHTHGGQIRFPLIGAIVSASQLGLRFVMGRYQVGKMTLYTSRGIGLEGLGAPRARFLCPPEIILWTIQGE